MQKYKSNITTTSGAAVRGVPVLVIDEDGNNAALFLDRAGTVPAPNPLTTGPDGVFYFYAVNGRYSIRTTVDGVTVTDDDVVLMMDPEEITVAGPIAEAVAAAQAAAIAAEFAVEASGIPELVAAAQNAVVDANNAVSQASTAASNAAISRSDADSARDAAEIAKNAAEAALDSFDDRYLGAKASAPATDNDGGALLTGALYWDTSLPGMRSWNGSAWVTLPAATKASVGLEKADNTSDADKPVSTAQSAAIAASTANNIHEAAAKTTPADADELGYVDSAAGWGLVKLTWAGLKAALLAYFKGQFREKLTAPRTYYVRTDGSDANTGLSNTAGGAFATIQKAIDVVAALDVSAFKVTIQVGAGTYAPFALKPYVGAVGPLIVGDTTTPANVLINATAAGVNAVVALDAGQWSVAGLKVQSSSASGYRIEGSTTLSIVGYSEFGACVSRHVFAYRSVVFIEADLRITGGAVIFLEASYPGAYVGCIPGYKCTFVGAPTYTFTVAAAMTGLVFVNGITFSGAVTGQRYSATTNGVIQTFGSGGTYLPGSTPGAVATGGLYQ